MLAPLGLDITSLRSMSPRYWLGEALDLFGSEERESGRLRAPGALAFHLAATLIGRESAVAFSIAIIQFSEFTRKRETTVASYARPAQRHPGRSTEYVLTVARAKQQDFADTRIISEQSSNRSCLVLWH
jgi:hypothetical protein